MWIKRDISEYLRSNQDLVQIIRGPRQCGKSSLVLNLDPEFEELSLDDLRLREFAEKDPDLFLSQFAGKKLFIDEVQYAPNLFPAIKRQVDLYKRKSKKRTTLFRLTGSNQILMDRHVKESLAGRVSYYDLNTLTVSEILEAKQIPIQQILYQGGWPELYAVEDIQTRVYLDNYISSYIEKDIVLSAGIQKRREFLRFIQLLAGRVGNLLDYSSLGRDAGVEANTIKDWISILEQMHIISLVMPYQSNLTSRLVKAPKVYFLDTGLACRLQGWSSPVPILTSPQQGGLFENLVYAEIHKLNINHRLGWKVFHWRSRDGEEIDFLIEQSPTKSIFVEAKVSSQTPPSISKYREVLKVFKKKIPSLLLCHQEGERIISNQVPIAQLAQKLLIQN